MMLGDLISQVRSRVGFEADHVDSALEALLGSGDDAEKVDFLVELSKRGETAEEISFWVASLRKRAVPFPLPETVSRSECLDVCGTGGDGRHTFNVSTCASFIVAAAGVPTVKHGNRGVTSKCGGMDVLESMGVPFDMGQGASAECLRRHGLAFIFAPRYHPVFKHLAPLRKMAAERGCRTVFNLLGPLLNPAGPMRQVVGVYDFGLPAKYAEIMMRLGHVRALSVCGRTASGKPMDEMSVSGTTEICEWDGERLEGCEVSPEECLGDLFPDLKVGEESERMFAVDSPEASARVLVDLLKGEDRSPRLALVVLNAAAGLRVAGRARGWREAAQMAEELIASGKAFQKWKDLRDFKF